jgi:hypothetical protein
VPSKRLHVTNKRSAFVRKGELKMSRNMNSSMNYAHSRIPLLKRGIFADCWKAECVHNAGSQIVGYSGRVYTLAAFRQLTEALQPARIVPFFGMQLQVNPSSVISGSMEPWRDSLVKPYLTF